MSRGREITRLRMKRIIDQALGAHSVAQHSALATRQAQISIPNRHMLPVLVLSVRGFPAPPQNQSLPPLQVNGKSVFLAGYSAAAGTPAAQADATGRGGDTVVSMVLPATGGARGSARLALATPMTAVGSGGSSGTAALVIV